MLSLVHVGVAIHAAGCRRQCHQLWLGWSQGVLSAVVVLNILVELWKSYHEASRWKEEHARALVRVLLCRTAILGSIILCAVEPHYGKFAAVCIVVPSAYALLLLYKTSLTERC